MKAYSPWVPPITGSLNETKVAPSIGDPKESGAGHVPHTERESALIAIDKEARSFRARSAECAHVRTETEASSIHAPAGKPKLLQVSPRDEPVYVFTGIAVLARASSPKITHSIILQHSLSAISESHARGESRAAG
jgi:hypothetical protein